MRLVFSVRRLIHIAQAHWTVAVQRNVGTLGNSLSTADANADSPTAEVKSFIMYVYVRC